MARGAEAAGEGWWEVLVMLQLVTSSLFEDTGFTDRQPDHFPEIGLPSRSSRIDGKPAFALLQRGSLALATLRAKAGSGSGSYTHLKKFMRLPSVHWSSFPQ
jgi:hypothetical protein